ncbi:MAG TPA: hypothetical protein VGA85_07575 [Dehalococcoidales bacterium]
MSNNTNEQDLPFIKMVNPKYSPNHPPKNYSERRAIGMFFCQWYDKNLKCTELLRAVNSGDGDIYVIPFPEYKIGDIHISHHKSGNFHWSVEGNNVDPVFGEKDFPTAFTFWVKAKNPPCFCIRKGRPLHQNEIRTLVECISNYVPFPFDIEIAVGNLVSDGFYRFTRSDSSETKSRRFFRRLLGRCTSFFRND